MDYMYLWRDESLYNDYVKIANLEIIDPSRIDTADNTAYNFLIVD